MMRRRRILIDHGSYANLGDAAMLEGVVRKLHATLPDVELHVVEHDVVPIDLSDLTRVKSTRLCVPVPSMNHLRFVWRFGRWLTPGYRKLFFSRLTKRSTLDRMEVIGSDGSQSLMERCAEFDSLHIAGGGNLTDGFPMELWQRCCLINAFVELGKPVVLSGQQIGPFTSSKSVRLVQEAITRATFAGLRDPGGSLAFCNEHIESSNYSVMGDDSFGIAAADQIEIERLLGAHGLQHGRFIAANFRISDYSQEHEANLDWYVKLLGQLQNRFDMPILFVPISISHSDNDAPVAERIAQRLPRAQLLQQTAWSAQAAKGVLSAAFGAVGASYHFCTFSLSVGTPAVCTFDGAYYDQKASGIAALWQNPGLALRLGSVSVEDATAHVAGVFEDNVYRAHLDVLRAGLATEWVRFFEADVPRLHGISVPKTASTVS